MTKETLIGEWCDVRIFLGLHFLPVVIHPHVSSSSLQIQTDTDRQTYRQTLHRPTNTLQTDKQTHTGPHSTTCGQYSTITTDEAWKDAENAKHATDTA